MSNYQEKKKQYINRYLKSHIHKHVCDVLSEDRQFYHAKNEAYFNEYRAARQTLHINNDRLDEIETLVEDTHFSALSSFFADTQSPCYRMCDAYRGQERAADIYEGMRVMIQSYDETIKNASFVSEEFKQSFENLSSLTKEYDNKYDILDHRLCEYFGVLYNNLYKMYENETKEFLITKYENKDEYIRLVNAAHEARNDNSTVRGHYKVTSSVLKTIDDYYAVANDIYNHYLASFRSTMYPHYELENLPVDVKQDIDQTNNTLHKFSYTISNYLLGYKNQDNTQFNNSEFALLKPFANDIKSFSSDIMNRANHSPLDFNDHSRILNIYDRKVLNVMSSWKTFAKGLEVSQNATEFNKYLSKNL